MTDPNLFTREDFEQSLKEVMSENDRFIFECLSKTREELEAELPNKMYDISTDGFAVFTGKKGFINFIMQFQDYKPLALSLYSSKTRTRLSVVSVVQRKWSIILPSVPF